MTVANTTPPVVSGTLRVGQLLTTTPGEWTFDEDYLTYAYRWQRCDAGGGNCIWIPGATNQTYRLVSADANTRIGSEVTATEHVYTDPDPLLTWEPPTAGEGGVAIVNWTMTNANRMSNSLLSGGGRDLVITSGEPLNGPVMQLHNWRHIIWIGGEIDNTPGSGDNYALPISATGTVHLEGLDIACDGDVIMTRGGGPNCIIQIQNCRLSAHFLGEPREHSDCFQFQGGSKVNSLRFDKCTMTTDYQGFFLRLPDSGSYCNGGEFRRINFRRRDVGQDPDQAFIFIADEDPATGHGPGQSQIGNIVMSDVWVEATHSSGSHILYPSWNWETALQNPPSGQFGNKEGLFKLTDGTSQYVRPSTTSDTVPSGGSASGQQAESAGWTGIIRMQTGAPPAGDWCDAATPGHGYTSPGYV